MFRSTTTIKNASGNASAKRPLRRLIALGAPLAFLALAAPAANAEPWFHITFGDWGRRPQHREPERRPPVVITRPVSVRPEYRRPVEEVPCDLRFTAYQTRDTVILIATGENRSAGYATCLEVCGDGFAPTVTLRNTTPRDACSQVISRFEVSGSFRAKDCLRTITVRVADRCFQVPVTEVRALS